MRRLKGFAFLLAVTILIVAAGCGKGSTETTGVKTAAPETKAAAPATEAAAKTTEPAAAESEDADTTEQDESEAPEAAPAVEFDENVPLYVTAFVGRNEPDGIRTDPVSRYIEEALNIQLELTGVIESDYPTQLSGMIASDELPDIFLFSDVVKQFPMLMASNRLLALDDYLEPYAQETLDDPKGALMIEAYRSPATSPDGKLYLWGLCKGSWDDGTLPTCGHYIRWDLYKEAGYPKLETYDEDLLDVIEAMVAQEPETEDGQKVYGVGAWFGNGQDWGEWVFTYGLAPQQGVNLVNSSARTVAVSTKDSTPLENNQLKDPEGYLWRAVRFYNRANQRGLLDPDSFTQASDVYESRLHAGRYVFNVPGWMSSGANNEYNKTDGNTRAFVSLPALGSDAEDRFGNMYKGERAYGVNASTEYPERCVALLSFVSSYEFSRIAWNGPEGINWDMEDGVPVPRDEFLTAERDDEFTTRTGASVYHHFMGYGNGTVDPVTGVPVDLFQFSAKALERRMNDTIRDFISHYGQETLVDVYKAETETTTAMNFLQFGEAPADIQTNINNLNAFMGKNIFKVVAAKDDAEFIALRDDMIEQMAEFDVDGIFDHFYAEALEQTAEVEKLAALASQ